MKIIRFPELPILTVIAGLSLFVSAATYAQAPAGPLTGVPTQPGPAAEAKPPAPLPPPRTSILGAWKFNRDESDDPRKRAEDDRGSNNGGYGCLLYTSPSPRDGLLSRMPSSA